MALPPKQITIKRRRDEEPVDCLHLEKQFKRRRHTAYVFTRIQEDDLVHSEKLRTGNALAPDPRRVQSTFNQAAEFKVPVVRATSPDKAEIYLDKPRDFNGKTPVPESEILHSTKVSAIASEHHQKTGQDINHAKPPSAPVEPRKFYLTKSASLTSFRHNNESIQIQQTKKFQKPPLAVFVERREANSSQRTVDRRTNITTINSSAASIEESSVFNGDVGPLTSQKRPNVSVAEKARMIETQARINSKGDRIRGSQISGLPDAHSLELAEQLHSFTLQQIAETKHSTPGLKFQPKPAPQRQNGRPHTEGDNRDDVMDLDEKQEDRGDYVYDTFVRQIGPPQDASQDEEMSSADLSPEIKADKVGLLIIAEEDEEAFCEYGGEEDSDKDWNSEEEDENAEDFYGNDYPEDEVASDDECGRNPYQHRRGGSDDEEYDEDTIAWSDEEDLASYPWQRKLY